MFLSFSYSILNIYSIIVKFQFELDNMAFNDNFMSQTLILIFSGKYYEF